MYRVRFSVKSLHFYFILATFCLDFTRYVYLETCGEYEILICRVETFACSM